MGIDGFNLSSESRKLVAVNLLSDEVRTLSISKQAGLLSAMWKGWYEVMHLKLEAEMLCYLHERNRRQSGKSTYRNAIGRSANGRLNGSNSAEN